jgi:RNA polymerase sigma-70 factor (ECF subfamily)
MFFRFSSKRKQLSDEELIDRFKETDDSQFVGELFERYAVQIYGICRKYLKEDEEARDASMEIFEYLLKELKKYEVQKFKSWLGSATRNFCLMRLRKEKSATARAEEYKKSEAPLMEAERDLHPMEEDDRETQLVELELALGELKDEQKVCIELFFIQGKSYDEVAVITGYSYNQVKSYIQNGKRNLRILMTRSDE